MSDTTIITTTGNLTRDPEIVEVNEGSSKCSFAIAVNSRIKRDGEWTDGPTNYHDVEAWDSFANNCYATLAKGMQVSVHGEQEMQEWTDKNTGEAKRRRVIKVNKRSGFVAVNLEFASAEVTKNTRAPRDA